MAIVTLRNIHPDQSTWRGRRQEQIVNMAAAATLWEPIIGEQSCLDMDASFLSLALLAVGAAAASPAGGALSLLFRPSSLLLSLAVGFAGGVLLAALAFEMVPKALELADAIEVYAGIPLGVLLVWGFDLYINRGLTAGEKAAQSRLVRRYHRRHKPHGGKVALIAGATAGEEVIEGIVIGVSAAVGGSTGLIVAIAIAVNNVSEALSIGELAFDEAEIKHKRRQVLIWTGVIGLALVVSAFAGFLLLRGIPAEWRGFLTAVGAGAMFYLATAGLIPEAESHQFEQSGGLAAAAGFLTMLVIAETT
jgi:zinc transporter, ZIP family